MTLIEEHLRSLRSLHLDIRDLLANRQKEGQVARRSYEMQSQEKKVIYCYKKQSSERNIGLNVRRQETDND